jgi:integrase
MRVSELKKGHIKTWMEKHPTWRSPATQRSVLAVVLAAFNHAEQMHSVPSPLKGLKKPQSQPRLHSFSAEDEKTLYEATDEPFRNFLFAAIHTGLRPFCELAQLKADDVEEISRGMMWRVYSSKTKKTRKIPVRPEVAELTRRLMKTARRGSGIRLFRNSRGGPWTSVAGVVRFLALKAKLGWDKDPVKSKYSSYTCRHTFAHRMLSGYWNDGKGCSIEALAELIGDTPKVAFDHYGKEWGQHYQDPLWAAIGTSGKKPSAAKRRTR